MSDFRDAGGYERFMGRWSARLARELIRFAAIPDDARVLDVGCGTGSFTEAVLSTLPRATAVGVDPSATFVELASRRFPETRARFETGDATRLTFPDASFGAAVAMLVLNFVPDPGRAVAEMRRVTRPGGRVAASVWDYGGEMTMLRTFWDTAVALDPAAGARHEERMPLCHRGELEELWRGSGLDGVREEGLVIEMPFSTFGDFWSPFLAGVGPAGSYAAALSSEAREALKRRLLRDVWDDRPEQPRRLTGRAWVVVGTVRDD